MQLGFTTDPNKRGYLSISSTHSTEAQLLATLIMSPTLIQENN